MPTLPVFSLIKNAFAFFALHLGALCKLFAVAFALTVAAGGLAAGGYALTQNWVVAVPCLVFLLFAWSPFMLRVYQLAAVGEMDPSGYLSAIFTAQSARYVGYSLLTGCIVVLGFTLSFLPAMLTGVVGATSVTSAMALGVVVSLGLAATFLVLIAPINLIFPAVALEREPSLGKAYALGAGCKLRLLAAMAAPWLFFLVLGQMVDLLSRFFGADQSTAKAVLLLPLHLVLAVTGTVINAAVPALAYGFLRRLTRGQGASSPAGAQVQGPSVGAEPAPDARDDAAASRGFGAAPAPDAVLPQDRPQSPADAQTPPPACAQPAPPACAQPAPPDASSPDTGADQEARSDVSAPAASRPGDPPANPASSGDPERGSGV